MSVHKKTSKIWAFTKNIKIWAFTKKITIPAACSYWRWGGSGRQENINAICILGLNIVNDKVSKHNLHCQCIILILNGNLKVFLILWWWFLLLVLIGLVRLVYRAVQCRSRSCLHSFIVLLQVRLVALPSPHDETLPELQEVNEGRADQGLCQGCETRRLVS